jgi:hypothetical protein
MVASQVVVCHVKLSRVNSHRIKIRVDLRRVNICVDLRRVALIRIESSPHSSADSSADRGGLPPPLTPLPRAHVCLAVLFGHRPAVLSGHRLAVMSQSCPAIGRQSCPSLVRP